MGIYTLERMAKGSRGNAKKFCLLFLLLELEEKAKEGRKERAIVL